LRSRRFEVIVELAIQNPHPMQPDHDGQQVEAGNRDAQPKGFLDRPDDNSAWLKAWWP